MTSAETYSRFFRAWRLNRSTGLIEGIYELSEDRCPRSYCVLVEDDQGRLLRIEEYRAAESEIPFVKVFGYADESSLRISEALDYNPDGSIRLIHRYVYDGDGPLIDRIELDGGGNPRGHVTSRWEDDVEVEETVFDSSETIRSRHRYTRDAAGNPTSEEVYDGEGKLQGTYEMVYDERDNLIEKRWSTADGRLQSRFVHRYNADDLMESVELYGADDTLQGRRNFEYDDVGNVTREFS